MNAMQEADNLINGQRREDYGDAVHNFNRIAIGWSAILDIPVTEQQVALCMAWLKMARQVDGAKRDNIVDGIGYLGLIDQMGLCDTDVDIYANGYGVDRDDLQTGAGEHAPSKKPITRRAFEAFSGTRDSGTTSK